MAAPREFWNAAKRMHSRLGFHDSYFEDRLDPGTRIGPWLNDRDFLEQMANVAASQPSPFMAFLLTGSNHCPFHTPDAEKRLFLGSLEGTVLGNYL